MLASSRLVLSACVLQGSTSQAGLFGSRQLSTSDQSVEQIVTLNLRAVDEAQSEIWGTRNPKLITGKRSGWKILRDAIPIGEMVNNWYVNSLWDEGVPRYQEERHFIRKEELAYRRLKGKPVPPKKGEGKRKTKKK